MSSSSPSGSWQDRRFMFPTGREVHEGSRRMSQSSSKSDDLAVPPAAAAPAAAAGAAPVSALPDYPVVEKKVLSNPDAWGGDRRFMGMLGKEVHQPARRMSGGSGGAAKPTVDAASPPPKSSASPPASSGGGIAGAIAGRRRSSASSQGGVFGGLMANRSAHDERRQGWDDMKKPEGLSGFFSGLVNKPAEKK